MKQYLATRQWVILGLFSGATLFLAFLYVYPLPSEAPAPIQQAITNTTDQAKMQEKEITFSVLDQGEVAPGAKNRKNYAIYTQNDLNDFWKLSHPASDKTKAPTIDFKKQYVLVFFAGVKPTTGYKIAVTKVKDTEGKRNIDVAMIEPGVGCKTKEEKTSPYQFVSVPYNTETTFSHTDVTQKKNCK